MLMIIIIIGAILVIMAIIGYVAEKKDLVKKKEIAKKQDKVSEINLPADNTWSSETKPKDEKEEIVYNVPSMDDWSTIPTDLSLNEEDASSTEDVSNGEEEMFSEIKTNDLEVSSEPIMEENVVSESSDKEVLPELEEKQSETPEISSEENELETLEVPQPESVKQPVVESVKNVEEKNQSEAEQIPDQQKSVKPDYNFNFANQVSSENELVNLNNAENMAGPQALEPTTSTEILQVSEPVIETPKENSNQNSIWN